MDKVKNFFKKIWSWLKKAYKVVSNFLTENVWAGVLAIVIGILLFIFVVQGIVKGIDKCKNETTEDYTVNKATTITTTQLMEKIDNGETFVLFLGYPECGACQSFYKTVNTYISSGKTIYYVNIYDDSDPVLNINKSIIIEKLQKEVPEDRNITGLATPTTIYVKNGVFADAVVGAYGMSGGEEYSKFCDVIEGEYVGKATHGLVSSSSN